MVRLQHTLYDIYMPEKETLHQEGKEIYVPECEFRGWQKLPDRLKIENWPRKSRHWLIKERKQNALIKDIMDMTSLTSNSQKNLWKTINSSWRQRRHIKNEKSSNKLLQHTCNEVQNCQRATYSSFGGTNYEYYIKVTAYAIYVY